MPRFLLSLSLIGAAICTLLIFSHDVLTDGKAEYLLWANSAQSASPAPEFMGRLSSDLVVEQKSAIGCRSAIHSIAASAK